VSVGGQVVDRIIRHGEAEPVKPVTVNREKPFKAHKKVRQRKKNLQAIKERQEDEAVSRVGAVVDEESPLREREIDMMNESIMVNQLTMEGNRPGGSDMAAAVDVKQVVRSVPPASPMSKESLGNCLMKVGDSVCI